jgi:hypothetical protein
MVSAKQVPVFRTLPDEIHPIGQAGSPSGVFDRSLVRMSAAMFDVAEASVFLAWFRLRHANGRWRG